MFKKKKKVIYSLLAATILSSSAASAASYNSTNINYNWRFNNYSPGYGIYNNYKDYYYDSDIEQNTVVDQYPTFTWTVVNRWPSKPTPPIANVPEAPVERPTRPERPVERPVEPELPIERPSQPEKPETPIERPTRPETPVERPTEPEATVPSVSGILPIEMEVINLVNIERQKEGLAPLNPSSALSNVARKKSEDMAVNNYFSHTSPTYGSSSNMMRTFGINSSYSGENIAKGQLSAQSVVRGWMNSSGHRDNIMNPNFKTIGVGYYQSSNGTNLWTQMFTN